MEPLTELRYDRRRSRGIMTSISSHAPFAAPAVFLDRDGTVIEDRHYLSDPAQVVLLSGVGEAMAQLSALGFRLVLISNQSGVGRGLYDHVALSAVHARMVELLAPAGVALAGSYYCEHAPWEGCDCRKPAPGMIQRAAGELHIDLRRSWMIGDHLRDVEAGRRAGCQSILLRGRPVDDVVVLPDLSAAARYVAEMRRHDR